MGFILYIYSATPDIFGVSIAYVRFKLEYCSVVWQSHCITYNNVLENVQWKFYFYIMYSRHPVRNCAQNMLQELDLQSLQEGRKDCVLFIYMVMYVLLACSVGCNLVYLEIRTPAFCLFFARTNILLYPVSV